MDEDKSEDPCVEYVHSDTGLFPLPLARNTKSSHKTKIKNKFQVINTKCTYILASDLSSKRRYMRILGQKFVLCLRNFYPLNDIMVSF
jgi:hypothetical protein